jgi:hypothetical protein
VYDMTEVPGKNPLTTPPPLIVATPGDALFQLPPPVASLSVVVEPTHTIVVPVITAGNGSTVTVVVTKQPVTVIIYDMTDVPAETPVTTPVAGSTVATPGVALLHVPSSVASLSVIVEPSHTLERPVIAAGKGSIVTVADPDIVFEHVVPD